MQAWLDRDLIDLINAKNVSGALDKIRNPRAHMDHVISTLVDAKVQECVQDRYQKFLNAVRTCLELASRSADGATGDRAGCFLRKLRSGLLEVLKDPASSHLNSAMPDAKNANFNCDDQMEIFKVDDKGYICQPLLNVLDGAGKMTDYRWVDISSGVLKFFNTYAHQADRGVRARCGTPCPICRCPCTRTRGHDIDGESEDRRHDTHHQPIGLVGGYLVETNELMAPTCCNDNYRFKHTDGEWYSYSKFGEVFNDWCQPTQRFPLPLREYIFFNYQDELVLASNGKIACSDLPTSYDRSLKDIEANLVNLCSQGS